MNKFKLAIYHFPGTIFYYFEVKIVEISDDCSFYVGLSDGNIAQGTWIGNTPNCYYLQRDSNHCWRSMEKYAFSPHYNAFFYAWRWVENVVGCGLLLDSDNKWSIFFTLNGVHCGRKIPIKDPSAAAAGNYLLYPTVHMRNATLRANFGDNSAKPFKYNDISQCTPDWNWRMKTRKKKSS